MNSSQPESAEFGFYEGALIEARRHDCSHSLYSLPVGTFFLKAGEDFLETMACLKQPNVSHRHL